MKTEQVEKKKTLKIEIVAGNLKSYCDTHLMSMHDVQVKEEAKQINEYADIVLVLPRYDGHEPMGHQEIKRRSEQGKVTKIYTYEPKDGQHVMEEMEKQYDETLFIEYLQEDSVLTYRKLEQDMDILEILYENICRIGGAGATYKDLVNYIKQEFGYVQNEQGEQVLTHQGEHKQVYIQKDIADSQLKPEIRQALEKEDIVCHILE